jgi:tetraacyldisaccharide 4'-kinase
VAFRLALYERGLFETVRVPVPVFCLGNLTVGGSGKTPGVIWLAERLRAAGRRPAVVTRGYGRRGRDLRLVPNAGEPLPEAREIGDEPRLLAARLPGVPLAVAADRARAAESAWETFGSDCLIMDDGFQHRRLDRDRDLLCLDAALAHRVFARGAAAPLLPAGPWREPPRAAARAHALFLTRAERLSPEARRETARALAGFGSAYFSASALTLREGPGGPVLPEEALRGAPVLAVSGLGDPRGFEAGLARLGAQVDPCRFPDHHWFTARDLAAIRRRAGGRRIVVTEKDAQRLPPDFPAAVARLDWRWEGEDPWGPVIESVFR